MKSKLKKIYAGAAESRNRAKERQREREKASERERERERVSNGPHGAYFMWQTRS